MMLLCFLEDLELPRICEHMHTHIIACYKVCVVVCRSTYATEGVGMKVQADVERVLKEFIQASKPIGSATGTLLPPSHT